MLKRFGIVFVATHANAKIKETLRYSIFNKKKQEKIMQYSRISSQEIGYLRLFLDLLSDDSGKYPKNAQNSGKNQISQGETEKSKPSVIANK